MTGFQPHPGLAVNVLDQPAPAISIENLCASLGVPVAVLDPYDLETNTQTIYQALQESAGVRVLVLRRTCALVQGRAGGYPFIPRWWGPLPGRRLRLQPLLFPGLPLPRIDLGCRKRAGPDRRGHLRRLRGLRADLPPGGHHPGNEGGGMKSHLFKDPVNLIITGVGGQGNVLSSQRPGPDADPEGISGQHRGDLRPVPAGRGGHEPGPPLRPSGPSAP